MNRVRGFAIDQGNDPLEKNRQRALLDFFGHTT
jgi:hypothetical protein